MDFKEIINAWISRANPSDLEKKIALQRFEICDTCEFKKFVIQNFKSTALCKKCGCPISTKIFSPKQNSCPEGKWKDIDNEFFKSIVNKSII